LGTRVFMVEIGGFDTHAEQYDYHLNILKNVADGVKAFYDDLAFGGNTELPNKVLGMTYSEFGRTIYENASLGTDHGWGTPMMLFGGGIGNGFTGQYQDLSSPDPYGDPAFSVDFRSVYSTILQDWMGNSPELVNFVMGQNNPTLQGLVPPATPLQGDNGKCALLGHNPHPSEPTTIQIKYAMLQNGPVRLQILDGAGHVLRTVLNEFRDRGTYTFNFKAPEWYIAPGLYQYRLQSGGQVFQRDFKV